MYNIQITRPRLARGHRTCVRFRFDCHLVLHAPNHISAITNAHIHILLQKVRAIEPIVCECECVCACVVSPSRADVASPPSTRPGAYGKDLLGIVWRFERTYRYTNNSALAKTDPALPRRPGFDQHVTSQRIYVSMATGAGAAAAAAGADVAGCQR